MTDGQRKENVRIAFVMERDGAEAAEIFVEQTLALYVNAAIEQSPHKDSIRECERFLADECEKSVRLVVVDSESNDDG